MGDKMFRLRVEVSGGPGPAVGGFEVVFENESQARGALAKLKSQVLASGMEVYELGQSTQDVRVMRLLQKMQKEPEKRL